MYGHHIWQSMDQLGKVANPARGQLNRENEYSPVPVQGISSREAVFLFVSYFFGKRIILQNHYP